MRRIFTSLSDLVRLSSIGLLILMVAAITVQVGGRYVLLRGIPYTDEIAQVSLTWMVFLAAPWVYRIKQHITVQLPIGEPSSLSSRTMEVIVHVFVIVMMFFVVRIGIDMYPMMSRIYPGSLPISRFVMHFLPLLIGSALIIVFAIEAIFKIMTSNTTETK